MNIPIDQLFEYEHNPRSISKDDFERLKKELEMLGQHSPLLVTALEGKYTVLGGNMRLRALRELGVTEVWCSIVEFKQNNEGLWFAVLNNIPQPKRYQSKEDGMMEYSLSHNDRAGYVDTDKLANLMPNYQIDWDAYSVDIESPITAQELVDSVAPEKVESDEFKYQVVIDVDSNEQAEQLYNQSMGAGYKAKIRTMAKRGKK